MVSILEARYRSDCGPLVVGGVRMLAAGFASDFHLGGRRQCRRPPRQCRRPPQGNAVAPPPQGIAIA
jgi:hypothetical protein